MKKGSYPTPENTIENPLVPRRVKNIIGNKYGKLLVLGYSHVQKGNACWYVVCDCGIYKTVFGTALKSGRTQSCGKCQKYYKDINGQRYGRLLVTGYSHHDKHNSIVWDTICDCGNTHKVLGSSLRKGQTQSCGCLWKEERAKVWEKNKLPEGEASFNALLSRYKQGAKQRELVFDLSSDQFRDLIQQPCFYCGNATVIETSFMSLPYAYSYVSGLDRKDNSIGYTEQNVVPCCWTCNKMKGLLNMEEFLAQVHNISATGV